MVGDIPPVSPRSGFEQDVEGSPGIAGTCQGDGWGTWVTLGALGTWEYWGT